MKHTCWSDVGHCFELLTAHQWVQMLAASVESTEINCSLFSPQSLPTGLRFLLSKNWQLLLQFFPSFVWVRLEITRKMWILITSIFVLPLIFHCCIMLCTLRLKMEVVGGNWCKISGAVKILFRWNKSIKCNRPGCSTMAPQCFASLF